MRRPAACTACVRRLRIDAVLEPTRIQVRSVLIAPQMAHHRLRRVAQEPMTLDNARPLLETKFYLPKRRGVVARPRLNERLCRGVESKLVLVSAPAGFGKTTLLAEWLAAAPADGRSVAWLSLDPSDNQPTSFWAYVIAALQIAAPGVGASALSQLHDPQPPAIETVLATLINELSTVPSDVVLVLNDYHFVDAPDVQGGMAFLLEHLPPQVHLVIATRADPALPLAGLRGRGELVEIRAADLRFTPDEAAAYLNESMGLDLGAERRRRPRGADRRVDRRPPAGSALDPGTRRRRRLHRRLCRRRPLHRRLPRRRSPAPSDRGGPELPAAHLDPGPADAARSAMPSPAGRAARPCWRRSIAGTCSWSRLTTAAGGIATTSSSPTCCGRAWWMSSPTACLSFTGARATGTSRTATDPRPSATRWRPMTGSARRTLWSSHSQRCARHRQEAALLAWLRALPDEVVRRRPVLSVGYAWALVASGDFGDAEGHLQDAERWRGRWPTCRTDPIPVGRGRRREPR